MAGADLVIGMERRHVHEARLLGAEPARCFTLPELARRAAADEPRRHDESLADVGRSPVEHPPVRRARRRGPAAEDEIADPIGRGDDVYEATVDQLAALLSAVVDRAFPSTAAEVA